MKTTTRFLIAAYLMAASSFARGGDALPADIRQYADRQQNELKKMVAADPSLLKDVGVTSAELSALQLQYDRAFQMQRVDAARLETAGDHVAIVASGLFYVPFCGGARCPMMAAFGRDEEGAPVFASVGQANLTQQIQQTRDRLKADPSLDPDSLQAVQYNEANADFFLAKKAGRSEEVLVAESEAEEKMLLALLGRAPSEKDAAGRPRFSAGDLRVIGRNVRERDEMAESAPVGGFSDPLKDINDKPFNEPRTAPRFEPSAGRTGVLPITAPGLSQAKAEAAEEIAPPARSKTAEVVAAEPAARRPHSLAIGWGAVFLLAGVWAFRRRT